MSYDAATATAKAVLTRRGKAITLTRKGQGKANPIGGTRDPGGDKTAKFVAVGFPPGKGAEKEIGTLLNRRILQFYMARTSGTLDPMPGDQVVWGGATYALIWTATYDPDDSGSIFSIAYGEVS